eukprot:SAG31_NODE_2194_length_6224_cov_3.140408_9_plen_40_part_00
MRFTVGTARPSLRLAFEHTGSSSKAVKLASVETLAQAPS